MQRASGHQKVRDGDADAAREAPSRISPRSRRRADDVAAAGPCAAQVTVRDEWLELYATFTPEQKAVVRDLLQERVARAESFRQRMHERMQQRMGAGERLTGRERLALRHRTGPASRRASAFRTGDAVRLTQRATVPVVRIRIPELASRSSTAAIAGNRRASPAPLRRPP